MALPEEDRSRLAGEAGRIRELGGLGRSEVLLRLFGFLLECSLADRAPKEIEVAQEVFGKSATFDMIEDASVRVYIHRLRRKLDDFYAAAGVTAPRLAIPRGEYRLVMIDDRPDIAPEPVSEPAPLPAAPPAGAPGGISRRAWIGMGLLAAVNLSGWAIWGRRRPEGPFAAVAHAGLWAPLVASTRPTFVVPGDYFIFGEAPDAMQVTRLVREFEINSREDLDQLLMRRPALAGRYVDLDLHYLPVSTAQALQTLLPLTTDAARRGATPLRLMTMSQLSVERLKSSNIVYVGFLSGLGLLRDPLFDVSGFKVGASYDELVDRRSGRHYASDWSRITDGGMPRRDYGYLASLPGPVGNRILIVAGTRDAGVMQAAEVLGDPTQLELLAARTGGADAFEALYEVRTIGNLNLDSALIVARPLRAGAAWRPGAANQPFPDEPPGQARPPAGPR